MVREGTALKKRLLVGASPLSDRGLLHGRAIAAIREGQGHHDLAGDLVALAAVFDRAWSVVKDKMPVTADEVRRAAELGTQLLAAIPTQQRRDRPTKEAADLVARAYTLLKRAYEECRRAVSYLRWNEKDADRIMPPLGGEQRRLRRAK